MGTILTHGAPVSQKVVLYQGNCCVLCSCNMMCLSGTGFGKAAVIPCFGIVSWTMFHWVYCPPTERSTPTPHCSLLPNQQKAQYLYRSFFCVWLNSEAEESAFFPTSSVNLMKDASPCKLCIPREGGYGVELFLLNKLWGGKMAQSGGRELNSPKPPAFTLGKPVLW